MIIELDKLFTNYEKELIIDKTFTIASNYLHNTNINDLKNLTFKGKVIRNEDELKLEGKIEGEMIIEDTISLENVSYKFSSQVDENLNDFLKNNQNSIDIIEILWQNIVLEVPIRYTEVIDFDKYHGDGWKLVKEEDMKGNNPFAQLKEKMEKE